MPFGRIGIRFEVVDDLEEAEFRAALVGTADVQNGLEYIYRGLCQLPGLSTSILLSVQQKLTDDKCTIFRGEVLAKDLVEAGGVFRRLFDCHPTKLQSIDVTL